MFKTNNKSKLANDQFGVGSTITVSNSCTYLVVPYINNSISLLDLETMLLKPTNIQPVDVNFLTEDEARRLVDIIGGNYAFSDVTCNAKGFKGYKGKY